MSPRKMDHLWQCTNQTQKDIFLGGKRWLFLYGMAQQLKTTCCLPKVSSRCKQICLRPWFSTFLTFLEVCWYINVTIEFSHETIVPRKYMELLGTKCQAVRGRHVSQNICLVLWPLPLILIVWFGECRWESSPLYALMVNNDLFWIPCGRSVNNTPLSVDIVLFLALVWAGKLFWILAKGAFINYGLGGSAI